MYKNQKIYFFFLITFLVVLIVFSQEGIADDNRSFKTWTSIQLKYKLTKKWEVAVEEQLRLENDSSEIDQYFTQLTIGYNLFDNFELGGGFRFIKNNDNQGKVQGYENHIRFHFDTSYQHKINDLSVKYRLRYQNKSELEKNDDPNQHIRAKTTLNYKIKNWKLAPKLSAEIYNHFGKGKKTDFEKYRLTFGVGYEIIKIGSIDLSYTIEKEINVDNPKTTDILKLEYTYSF